MAKLLKVLLLAWFFVVNLFIWIPSYRLLMTADSAAASSRTPPELPEEPAELNAALRLDALPDGLSVEQLIERVKSQEQQVKAHGIQMEGYKARLGAFANEVDAYKTATQLGTTSPAHEAYKLVVKETVGTVIWASVVGLLTLGFAKVGAQVLDNHNRMRQQQPPQEIRILG